MNIISIKDLIRKLKLFGFRGPFAGGKHQFMVKGSKKLRIPNPHGSNDIGAYLFNEILKQAGISKKEWDIEK